MVSATSPLPLLLFLLSWLLGGHLHSRRCDAAGTAVLQAINCSTAGNYTPADAYAANLNQLLASLPNTTVSKNGGFFNGTAGQPGAAGTAYALALCATDFSRDDCRDCLAMATSNSSGLLKQCPGSSSVVALYDQCLVRFSDAAFFGTAYTDIEHSSFGKDTISTGRKAYSDALTQVFVQLSAQAVSTPQRFAVSKASPFALVQCTWDLPPESCKECLALLAGNISDFMAVTSAAEASTYSCRVRQSQDSFEVFPFADPTNNNGTTVPVVDEHALHSHMKDDKKRTAVIVVVSVGTALAALVAAVVVTCRVGRSRARRAGSITMGDTSVQIDLLQEYRYEELKKATGNFSKDAELGRGAFGVVYKGTLENKKVIAVKKLQRTEKMEVEQFMNEVSILSGIKHKNLVKLEGFCVHGQGQGQQEGLLCYEYLPDGNLEDRLHGRRGAAKLTWKERCHILRGICSGLQYLHNEAPNNISIIHMDLKADNILLQVQEDRKNGGVVITPKISDFGISRNHDTDKQHEYVDKVVGNMTCVPREFMERGKASPKVDIYSFGLIILEMVTGKSRRSSSSTTSSSSENSSHYGQGLILLVREQWDKKDIESIKDENMDTRRDDEIAKCIEIALECVQEDPAARPDISTLARMLNDVSAKAINK